MAGSSGRRCRIRIGRKDTYCTFFILGIALYWRRLSPPWSSKLQFVLWLRHHPVDYGGGFSTVPAYLADLFGTDGIDLSPDEKKVYIAETPTARLWAYDLSALGTLKPRDVI